MYNHNEFYDFFKRRNGFILILSKGGEGSQNSHQPQIKFNCEDAKKKSSQFAFLMKSSAV